ncbi:hypothetical protein J6590_004203 [Homalodisca vitripennis]|nr:hypothetical protein J6590_004203 [Homalodisca vitripennis]
MFPVGTICSTGNAAKHLPPDSCVSGITPPSPWHLFPSPLALLSWTVINVWACIPLDRRTDRQTVRGTLVGGLDRRNADAAFAEHRNGGPFLKFGDAAVRRFWVDTNLRKHVVRRKYTSHRIVHEFVLRQSLIPQCRQDTSGSSYKYCNNYFWSDYADGNRPSSATECSDRAGWEVSGRPTLRARDLYGNAGQVNDPSNGVRAYECASQSYSAALARAVVPVTESLSYDL